MAVFTHSALLDISDFRHLSITVLSYSALTIQKKDCQEKFKSIIPRQKQERASKVGIQFLSLLF